MALTSIGFAQTKQVPKTLSYEKAVELAIKNSLDIKQIDRKLQKIETYENGEIIRVEKFK